MSFPHVDALTTEPITEERTITYWQTVWRQLRRRFTAVLGLSVLAFFVLVGIYAPFLASSKPLVVHYASHWYFPLFRYLFFNGFYTKHLDLFFNILIFIFPLLLATLWLWRGQSRRLAMSWLFLFCLQIAAFVALVLFPLKDPAADPTLATARREALQQVQQKVLPPSDKPQPGQWAFDLQYMNDYAQLNAVLRYRQRFLQNKRLEAYAGDYKASMQQRWAHAANAAEQQMTTLPTLWQMEQANEQRLVTRYQQQMATAPADSVSYRAAATAMQWFSDRRQWLEAQNQQIGLDIMPLLRPYHWEDDAGGEQALNHYLSWLDLTRINHKDLMAALLFGVRVSLVVGVIAVALALAIGVPIGALAGYYGGITDIVVCRLLEIWEAMPSFLMLLMVVAIAQSKSIFLVISVIGIFGWTSFSRYIRGEFLKQRNLAYVEACRSLGFNDVRIIFRHILPNAVPPVLTLLPFAVMGAISSEAGLSFLGLGEEGSCSWGVLMDEGRTAFPGESYLLWPPALLLTALLVATALVGDALRDALDPKMHL